MAKQSPKQGREITEIAVAGYKSIRDEQRIEVRPLTLLCGANSSGKSSILQPVLLMKQTLEASFDPGALLLDGPNVRFTRADQLFAKSKPGKEPAKFTVAIRQADGHLVRLTFERGEGTPVEIVEVYSESPPSPGLALRKDTPAPEALRLLPPDFLKLVRDSSSGRSKDPRVVIERNRCFLHAKLTEGLAGFTISPGDPIIPPIQSLIHLPGLRGNPQRTYPVTAVAGTFPGTFERYVASVVAQWEQPGKEHKLAKVGEDLLRLGLTWKVTHKRVSDTEVELEVGRLPKSQRGGAYDTVSVADVGFGVSQVLPVLVALRVAHETQIVYIEQPELHLHPRAQVALAEVLCDAAMRGVRVIAETHSDHLLLSVRSLVVRGKVPPDLIKLHWFERNESGETQITSADLDQSGAFGDWPEDFADVTLRAESEYLDAVEAKRAYE